MVATVNKTSVFVNCQLNHLQEEDGERSLKASVKVLLNFQFPLNFSNVILQNAQIPRKNTAQKVKIYRLKIQTTKDKSNMHIVSRNRPHSSPAAALRQLNILD